MERLSALDAEFLLIEDGIAHMHIAGISVFEGPAPAHDELTEMVASKLHLIPRYRQRVRSVPLELGRPVWIDDPHFDLDYHIRHTALPAPGDDPALRRLMSRLMSQELDRERPLWELWFVEGLEGGRWALISKIHHCMVDGVSGVDLLSILLDVEPDVPLPVPRAWVPDPEPSGITKVLDAWSGLVADGLGMLVRAPSALRRDPGGVATSVLDTTRGVAEFVRHLGLTTPTTLEGSIGPHRSWAHSSIDLDDVKEVRRAVDATVNDVVLAVLAGAFRELLLHRGEDPDATVLRTLVPVSVRPLDARGVPDNRVSAILFELPVHVADPAERVRFVHEQMEARKASHMSEAGEVVVRLGDLAPPMVVGAVMRTATRLLARMPQRSVNTVTTNVPGPQFPLYCLGRRMVQHLPFVPLSHGVRCGVAILSYDGQLAFGVTGDRDTAADVDVLAGAVPRGFDELREQLCGKPPAKKRPAKKQPAKKQPAKQQPARTASG